MGSEAAALLCVVFLLVDFLAALHFRLRWARQDQKEPDRRSPWLWGEEFDEGREE